MRSLSIPDYCEYYALLTENDHHGREWQNLTELLVNCESGFLRHEPSYEALMQHVLPMLVKERIERGVSSLFMWSAGCSKGQEAYSMAMCFAQVFGHKGGLKAHITGTDISQNALTRARTGEYSSFEIRNMPQSFKDRYMITKNRDQGPHGAQETAVLYRHRPLYRIKKMVRDHVRFGFLNLNSPNDFWVSMQDVIFCQNVLIYFGRPDRARVIQSLLNRLKPGGYLFLAPGEATGIEMKGAGLAPFKDATAYRRNKEPIHVRVAKK